MGLFNLFKKEKKEPVRKNNYEDLLKKLAEDNNKDLIWFLLGSLISADTLISPEACRNSINMLNELSESIGNVSDDLYSPEEKEKIQKHCSDGLEICRQDLENFENGEQELPPESNEED